MVWASGLKGSIGDYNLRYANAVPNNMDSYLLQYYSLENEDELRQVFSTIVQNVTLSKLNEPDPVCRCSPTQVDESSNYPRLSPSTPSFEDIRQVKYPSGDLFKASLNLTLNVKKFITQQTYYELVIHRGLWSFGITNNSYQFYANITGVKGVILFNVTATQSGRMRNQTVFLNSWMRYVFSYTRTQATLIIDDLSARTPVTISVNFTTPIKVEDVLIEQEATGLFTLRPQNIDVLLSKVTYTVGDMQLFDFDLIMDKYFQTATISPEVTFKNYQTKYIQGHYQSGDWQLLQSYPGLYFEQIIGPCNMSDPAFKFDGLVCKDQKKYLALNQKRNNGMRLESYLRSSHNMMTFEVWFKYQGMNSDTQQGAVMLVNYGLMDVPQLQISIVKSQDSGTYSIECDPSAKTPRVTQSNPVTIYNLVNLDVWMHYSCISNMNSRELKAYLLNSQTSDLFSSLQPNSYMVIVPEGIPVRTIFGNNINSTAQFKGFLREMRFWNRPRTLQEIEAFRFQSIPVMSEMRDQLYVYAMLNSGQGNQMLDLQVVSQANTPTIYLANTAQTTANYPSQLSSPISWLTDLSPLKICPPNTIYIQSTSCCVKSSFSAKIQKSSIFTEEDGKQLIVLKIQIYENYTGTNPIQQGLYNHSWNIVDVFNFGSLTGKEDHIKSIQKFIDTLPIDSERIIQIPQEMMIINASYSFKATVRSLIKNYDQFQEATIIVKPDCPQIRISPKPSDMGSLRVSSKMDPNLLQLNLIVKEECVDPQIQSLGIEWTISNQMATFVVSQDQRTLTFKSFNGVKQIQVTAKYLFKKQNDPLQTTEKLQDSINLEILDRPFSLQVSEVSKDIDSSKNDLVFDASISETFVNFPINAIERQIQYNVLCPSNMFYSDSDQKIYCTPSQSNGYLKIRATDTAAVNYQNYVLSYIMKSEILGYSEKRDFTISFYQNSYYFCPRMSLNSFTSYPFTADRMILKPSVMLNCLSEVNNPNSKVTNYNLTNIIWQVDGYPQVSDFLEISGLSATVKKTLLGREILKPYFSTNITLNATLNNGTVIRSRTAFTIDKADLVVNINSSHPNGSVPFNETMYLDASQSFDPDMINKSQLQVNWTYRGGEMKQNDRKRIELTPFDRLDMNLNVGTTSLETFYVDLVNPSYLEKPAKRTIYRKFEVQNDFRKSIFPSACQIKLSNNQTNYIFSKLNSTDVWIQASIDSNFCFTSTSIVKDIARFYIKLPDQIMQTSRYVQTDSFIVKKEDIALLDPGKVLTIDFIYLVSYFDLITQSSTKYDYVVKSVTINRVGTNIEVLLLGVENIDLPIEIGQESSYTLDASPSYDVDFPDSSNAFSFMWTCPDGLACDTTGPQLLITKSMRELKNLNMIGSLFKVELQVYSSKKQSLKKIITLKVIKQDYTSCLELSIENSVNNVISISRDLQYPMQLRLQTIMKCSNISITSIAWSASQGITPFWINSTIMTQINIPSSQYLPTNLKAIPMTVTVNYVITATSEISKNTLQYLFKVNIEGSKILASIQTSLSTAQVLELNSNQQILMSAGKSQDPDNPSQAVICQWTCPQQVINNLICKNIGCDITFKPSADLKFVNSASKYEVAEFMVVIQTLDGLKNATKSISVTLLPSQLSKTVPLCYIKNFHGKQNFEIDEQMLFYPKCQPGVINQTYPYGYTFEWTLTPKVTGVILNKYRLDIKPFQLLQGLTNKSAGLLTLQLKISSKMNEYIVRKDYKIPQIYEKVAVNSTIFKFEVGPSILYTLFTSAKATVSNFKLQSNQYFRLRALKTNDEQEILVNKFTGTQVDFYLPKNTIYIYLDVIENRRVGFSEYSIYSIRAENIYIYEATAMTRQQFNSQILPRLQRQPELNFDYNDISLTFQKLEDLRTLKEVVSGISKENQAMYNSLMNPQIINFYQNTVAKSQTNVKLLAGMMEIMTHMYLEGCNNGDFTAEINNCLNNIQIDLTGQVAMTQMDSSLASNEIKAQYIRDLSSLSQTACLSSSDKQSFSLLSNEIYLTTLIEGEFAQYYIPENPTETYQVYKISDFDRASSNLITQTSLDGAVTIRVYSSVLPFTASYLSLKSNLNLKQDGNTDFVLGQSYLSSNTTTQINLYNEQFTRLNIPNTTQGFKIDIELVIQPQMIPAIMKRSQTLKQSVRCVSREDNETQFEVNNLLTDSSSVANGKVICTSTHLTQFGVIFTPIDHQVIEVPTQAIVGNEDQQIFEKVPMLIYLLPALLAVFILLLAVLGLIMGQLEFSRPKRLYNKLSLTENLAKHSYSRLLGSMILQFNPIFNYVFKPNFYLQRPLRLVILTNYFLFVSFCCLLYYRWLPGGVRIADIFWFGGALMLLLTLLKPKLQQISFSLFYPSSSLNQWKTNKKAYRIKDSGQQIRRPQSAKVRRRNAAGNTDEGDGLEDEPVVNLDREDNLQSPQKTIHRKMLQQDDSQLSNGQFDDSMRFDYSVKRLVGPPKVRLDDSVAEDFPYGADSPTDKPRGDEILMFRGTKKQQHNDTSKSRQQVQQPAQSAEGQVSRYFNKIKGVQQITAPQEIELTDMAAISKQQFSDGTSSSGLQANQYLQQADHLKKQIQMKQGKQSQETSSIADHSTKIKKPNDTGSYDRGNSNDLLRSSIDSQIIQNNEDYVGFAFEPVQLEQTQPQVHIDLNELSLDAGDQSIDFHHPQQKDDEYGEEYYFEDPELDDDHQKEGGEDEEVYNGDFTGSSPTPLQQKMRLQAEEEGPRRRVVTHSKGNVDDVENIGFDNKRKVMLPEEEAYQEESTNNLESIYKNYRELKEQTTNKTKRLIGIYLLLLITSGLLFAHVMLMSDLLESQFQNWISCTMFTFMVLIFGMDTLVYAIVAWALKRTNGIFERRKCCSFYNLFVYWPLGRWKVMELEIELAKLKDFDKEYSTARSGGQNI